MVPRGNFSLLKDWKRTLCVSFPVFQSSGQGILAVHSLPVHFEVEITRQRVLMSTNFSGFFFSPRIKTLEFLLMIIPFNIREPKLKLREAFFKVALPGIYLHL